MPRVEVFLFRPAAQTGGIMIDMGWLGHIAFTWEFFIAVMSIVLIDLVLAGDNAVVIAMAVKNLQGKKRALGIMLGSGGAVVVRVICTFAVAQLLNMSFVKLIGGAVIIWPARTSKLRACGRRCGSSLWRTSAWASTTCWPWGLPVTATCSCCCSG
jgi:hypothetical protein